VWLDGPRDSGHRPALSSAGEARMRWTVVEDVLRTWGRVRDDGTLNRAEQRFAVAKSQVSAFRN
jgi:hypothetical protein